MIDGDMYEKLLIFHMTTFLNNRKNCNILLTPVSFFSFHLFIFFIYTYINHTHNPLKTVTKLLLFWSWIGCFWFSENYSCFALPTHIHVYANITKQSYQYLVKCGNLSNSRLLKYLVHLLCRYEQIKTFIISFSK